MVFPETPQARHSFSRHLAKKYNAFLEQRNADRIPNFFRRTRTVRTCVVSLLRKQPGSANAAREVPRIAKLIFGLLEDAKRFQVEGIEFHSEIEILNDVLIALLNDRIASKYKRQCGGYGEALLNAYIDIFVTATLPKTERLFQEKPGFLVYPATGSLLELDVMLEEFRLAFEFQGEHHYVEPKDQAKDAFKLMQCASFSRVLVPVNFSQLSGSVLSRLIVNSMIAYCGLYDIIANRTSIPAYTSNIKNRFISRFCKATQRIFLAEVLFGKAIAWLDTKSAQYIGKMSFRSPISSSTPAPRQFAAHRDLPVCDIYSALPYVRRYRSALKSVRLDTA
jgi:hypothetical protein